MFRDATSRINLENDFWKKTDILSKLHIVRGNKKVQKVLGEVIKRSKSNSNEGDRKIPLTKSEEQKVKEIYVQILQTLIGYTSRLKGYAASRNFTSIQQTMQDIVIVNSQAHQAQVTKTLGISAEEYLELLQVEGGLPINDMNFLLNAMISETIQ